MEPEAAFYLLSYHGGEEHGIFSKITPTPVPSNPGQQGTDSWVFDDFDVKLCKVIQNPVKNPVSCSNDVNYAKKPVKMHKKELGLL